MTKKMKKEDALAWVKGFEAAHEVERALCRKEPLDPAGAMALGLGVTELARRMSSEPGPDRARDDEVRIVRERWARLRRAYGL
jgi:hypothetical protein